MSRLRVIGSPDDHEEAHEFSHELLDLIPGHRTQVVIGGAGMFVVNVFNMGVKPQYRIAAFDEWAAHIRKQLEGLTNAHN